MTKIQAIDKLICAIEGLQSHIDTLNKRIGSLEGKIDELSNTMLNTFFEQLKKNMGNIFLKLIWHGLKAIGLIAFGVFVFGLNSIKVILHKLGIF